jgi:hypothetical protein
MKKPWVWVGLFVVGAVEGGHVQAAPPGVAEMEGREVDPMTQAFHLPEIPRGGYVAPLGLTKSVSGSPAASWDDPWELFLWQMSMPLGPACVDGDGIRQM